MLILNEKAEKGKRLLTGKNFHVGILTGKEFFCRWDACQLAVGILLNSYWNFYLIDIRMDIVSLLCLLCIMPSLQQQLLPLKEKIIIQKTATPLNIIRKVAVIYNIV